MILVLLCFVVSRYWKTYPYATRLIHRHLESRPYPPGFSDTGQKYDCPIDKEATLQDEEMRTNASHYNDVIMSAMASQTTCASIVYSTVCSKASKLRDTDLCSGNSPVTGEFPEQRASNVQNVSIWWRHHVNKYDWQSATRPCAYLLAILHALHNSGKPHTLLINAVEDFCQYIKNIHLHSCEMTGGRQRWVLIMRIHVYVRLFCTTESRL